MRPRLLDLYCGGGGAAMGYFRAGFDVVGVDIEAQPHYPFRFVQADALAYLDDAWRGFDAIHASPPCGLYSRFPRRWGRPRVDAIEYPDLLGPTRDALAATGLPYVIENVPGSPIAAGMLLCGTMFGLPIVRHRLFEASFPLPALAPAGCDHGEIYDPWQGEGRSARRMREAMGIDWLPTAGGASRRRGITGDLYNAIPPAYTEWIGHALASELDRVAA